MIKFISEQQINLDDLKRNKKKNRHMQQFRKDKSYIQMPSEIKNCSNTIKDLKHKSQQMESIKKRLLVLQIHQEKTAIKAAINQNKYSFLIKMKKQIQSEKQELQKHIQSTAKQLHQKKQKISIQKKQHILNLLTAKNDLKNNNKNDYIEEKDRHMEIKTKINKQKLQEIERKKLKKMIIKEEEKQIQRNISQHLNEKRRQVRANQSLQSLKFSKLNQQVTKRINELEKLQSIIIERQAKSKISSEKSQYKLKQFLKQHKPSFSQNKYKFPSLKDSRRRKQADIFTDLTFV